MSDIKPCITTIVGLLNALFPKGVEAVVQERRLVRYAPKPPQVEEFYLTVCFKDAEGRVIFNDTHLVDPKIVDWAVEFEYVKKSKNNDTIDTILVTDFAEQEHRKILEGEISVMALDTA